MCKLKIRSCAGAYLPSVDVISSDVWQALARACVPDFPGEAIPAATDAAVIAMVHRLVLLLDITADTEPSGTMDSAALRLAAGSALLRLTRRHDAALDSDAYLALALTIQVGPSVIRPPSMHAADNLNLLACLPAPSDKFSFSKSKSMPAVAQDPDRDVRQHFREKLARAVGHFQVRTHWNTLPGRDGHPIGLYQWLARHHALQGLLG